MSPAVAPRLALAAVVLLALWPMRDALVHPTTTLLGTSLDSVHHAWGQWHLARGSAGDTFWPVGAFGTVIGGPSLIVGALLVPLINPAGAYLVTCALQVALTLLGAACLTRRLGGGPWSAPAAALLLLCGRPLLAQIGWGVPEGAALGWLAFALVVGLGPGRIGVGVLTGALLGSSIVENPYTLPIVVIVAGCLTVSRLRKREFARLAGEAVGGAAMLGVWAVAAYGQEGNVATTAVGHSYQVLGATYTAEGVDGRAHLVGLLRSWTPLRYTGARLDVLLATGAADCLGWAPAALAGWAALRARTPRLALLAACGFVLLALGSFPAAPSLIPGPFFFTNFLTGLAVRPLTQPVRYLVPAGLALAIAGGWLVGHWAAEGRRFRMAIVFMVATVEAFSAGSLATSIPTFAMSDWACLQGLKPGPVASSLNLPPFETSDSAALVAQMIHEQPGTHRAIGGWTPRAERDPDLSRALAVLDGNGSVGPDALRALAAKGIVSVLLDSSRLVGGRTVAGPAARTCGGVVVVEAPPVPR